MYKHQPATSSTNFSFSIPLGTYPVNSDNTFTAGGFTYVIGNRTKTEAEKPKLFLAITAPVQKYLSSLYGPHGKCFNKYHFDDKKHFYNVTIDKSVITITQGGAMRKHLSPTGSPSSTGERVSANGGGLEYYRKRKGKSPTLPTRRFPSLKEGGKADSDGTEDRQGVLFGGEYECS